MSSEKTKRELEKILELSQDIICTINENGLILSISGALTGLLGYTPAEVTGKNYQTLIHPDDYEKSRANFRYARTGDTVTSLENRYLHKNGMPVPLTWSIAWSSEDNIFHCIGRDGAARQQAEELLLSLAESNRRYDYVTKATSDAIWDWDLKTNHLYWGDGFISIFGYAASDTNPDVSSWTNHIHPEDVKRVMDSIYQVINGDDTNWKEEYRYQRADLSYAYVVDRGFVIRNEEHKAIRMVGAMHDISERKRSLKQLKRFADDLYNRNRELQQFGYVVSHNLRSPVANIIGLTNLIESERDDQELIDRCIVDLKTSIYRLDEVIRDLSKILSLNDGATVLQPEQVNLIEILNNVKTDLKEAIDVSGAEVIFPEGEYVLQSHKAYLYSIFFNLISNAIKYCSEEKPKIVASLAVNTEAVVVIITDNGIGIDMDKHADDLFKPYKRFNYDKDGKGLGLFLVKSHLQALNGKIEIESEPGKGTAFTITLNKPVKEKFV